RHKESRRIKEAANEKLKQPSITASIKTAAELQNHKDELNRSLVEACLKANIPLHKLSSPAFRKWLVENVKGGGDIVSSYWMREKYLPEIKAAYDADIKTMLKEKDIIVMCDESTNRKGEAVFITCFKILPTITNSSPLLVIASVDVLTACNGDTTSKSIIKALNKFDVLYENVVGVSSDSAAYMNKCVKLLKELTNPNLIHIQCWDHKLDKVSKVFSKRLPRINECVKNCKKLFKNTRKRRHNYKKFLKDKYKFSQAKSATLFPLPVMSRWGSWKNSVVYLSEYVDDVTEYAKTLGDEVESVQYFNSLSQLDIQILTAEATFVKDYCGPVDNVILFLEGSKYPTAHRLYPQVNELMKHFEVVQNATDVKAVVPTDTKKALEGIASNSKADYVMKRFKIAADKCHKILKNYLENDPAKIFFKACEALFSPTKMLALKSMEVSEATKIITKHLKKLPFLNIPESNFVVLYLVLLDNVCDALKKTIKKDKDYCVVHDMILSMRATHPSFAEVCLKSIFFTTSNTDVERASSGYNDIVCPRRCRLLEGNAEIMVCLYLCDDLEIDSDSGTTRHGESTTAAENENDNPDDPDPVLI
ncbi:CGG triplet repeat-binding protein 1, partial [Frankliniella fusca]